MEENLVIVVDHDNICRLCLNSKGAMTNIFDVDEEITLQQQILCVTGLNAQPTDNLPSKICHKCRYIVELCCDLRDVVDKTQRILSGMVQHSYEEHSPPPTETENDKENINTNTELIQPEDHNIDTNTTEKTVINSNDETTEVISEETKSERRRNKVPKHLVCQICLTPFLSKEDVRNHVRTHYEGTGMKIYLDMQRPYECEGCGECGITKKQLVVHHRRHLGVNPYVCKHPGCTYVGKNQDTLRHHLVVHGGRSLVCERCGVAFRRRWELTQHNARAHPPTHTHTHSHAHGHRVRYRDYRFKCPYVGCEKAYASRGSLAAHVRAHVGERTYRCHLCHVAAYTSMSLLNRHVRMHERRRVSKCDKCPAQFEQYSAFYRHRVAAHGPWQPHRCHACSQGYQSEGQLNKHLERCQRAIRMRELTQQYEQTDAADAHYSDDTQILQEEGPLYIEMEVDVADTQPTHGNVE